MIKTKTLAVVVLLLSLSLCGFAQDRRWTVNAGGGFSPLLGDLDNRLNNGWNITGGAGYNFGSGISVSADYMYDRFGISQRLLDGSPGSSGNAHVWSLTLDPKFPLKYVGRVRPYLVGGVGYYRFSVPNFALPAGQSVTNGDSHSGPGGSLGLGFDVNLGDTGLMLFSEARYHYASTGSVTLHMVPLTVGIRW
jgi:opacity protein-like surface antigen